MENLSKISKFLVFIIISSFALWLGSYVLRQMIVYQFFDTPDLTLKSIYNENNLAVILYTLAPTFVINIISFLLFWVTLILFTIISKIKLKYEGWYFIIFLIFIVLGPLELFLLFKDFEIIQGIYFNQDSSIVLLQLIKDRMTLLSSFSLILIFSSFISILLFIYRPLRSKQ